MSGELGNILIVGGDEATRGVLSRALFAAGHQVTMVGDARQALALAGAEAFKLVIFPALLPDLAAQDFLTQIKHGGETGAQAAIAFGEPTETAELEQCLKAGADDYLLMPLTPALLTLRVQSVLERQHLRGEHEGSLENEELLKIERDIQIARRIQAGFLPEVLPKPEGWDLAARFQPAREVAGDFYDAFMLSQNRRLGFVIADVVDKGVPAALFMALVRSLTRAFAQQNYSISWADALEESTPARPAARQRGRTIPSTGSMALKNAVQLTNNYIVENHLQDNMFATLFFGMLDPVTGQLAYINAGHNPPAIYDASGKFKVKLKATGTPVGMVPGMDYRIDMSQLDPGDFIFCYTDGVTEARNAAGEFFTEKHLLELLAQPVTTAESLVDRIHTTLQEFMTGAVQFDDITMIALVRQPPPPPV